MFEDGNGRTWHDVLNYTSASQVEFEDPVFDAVSSRLEIEENSDEWMDWDVVREQFQ